MSQFDEVCRLLPTLSKAEKAQLLLLIAEEIGNAFAGIEHKDGVIEGEACIVGTRIPVWLLVKIREMGLDEASIIKSYPILTKEDLSNACNYYQHHSEEINGLILAHENG